MKTRNITSGGQNKKSPLDRLSSAPVGVTLCLLAAISVVLNLTLEILGRRSFSSAFSYLAAHPVMFLYNTVIILFTLSLCLIIKKRAVMLFFISALWIGLGVANCIVLGYRSSPLSAIDFTIVKSALGLFTLYLSVWQIILIAAGIAAFAALSIILCVKCPKCRVPYHKSLAVVAVLGLSLVLMNIFASEIGAIDYTSGELADAYDSYGFAYCFARSLVSQGVKRPDDYSDDAVDKLRGELSSLSTETPPETEGTPGTEEPVAKEEPDIIFVQLESFFDVRRVKWLETSDEVTPNFNRLKDNGTSGYLRMENVGGGTANSEFEVLTGMDLDHFGFGEYPYTTVLKNRSCESIANDLKSLGYSTHAMHNHTATFYDRHIVYSHLGFDSFTPAEMMNGLTYNPLGWERDEVLTGEIISALDSTEGKDFVFAVTVQGHGKYPEEFPDRDDSYPDYEVDERGDDFIRVWDSADPENDQISDQKSAKTKKLAEYSYYVNQLRETDDFIGELIAELEERGDPVVVVFYGDHLPALPITAEEIDGTLFDTDYAVWTNTDLFDGKKGGDFEAYMLSSYILSVCGIDEGDITKLHQRELASGEDLNAELKLLEYAQLYDPDEPERYERTGMRFGTRELTVTNIERIGNTLYISGSGFTEHCEVELSGFMKSVVFVSPELIKVENVYFSERLDEVVWLAADGTELTRIEIGIVTP